MIKKLLMLLMWFGLSVFILVAYIDIVMDLSTVDAHENEIFRHMKPGETIMVWARAPLTKNHWLLWVNRDMTLCREVIKDHGIFHITEEYECRPPQWKIDQMPQEDTDGSAD